MNIKFKALYTLIMFFSLVNCYAINNCSEANSETAIGIPFIIQNTNNHAVYIEIHPSGGYFGTNPTFSEGILKIKLFPKGDKEGKDYHKMVLYKPGNGIHAGDLKGVFKQLRYFHVFFSNSPYGTKNENKMATFQYNDYGDMSAPDLGPKAYPGYMLPKDGKTFTYETYTKPQGFWEVVCMGTRCQEKTTETNVSTESTTTQIDKTTENALSASVTAGVDYGTYSGESTVNASHKTTISKSVKTSIGKSHSMIVTNPGIEHQQIIDLGISGMYEFVAQIRYKGKVYTVRTGFITYMTEDDKGEIPTWLPGSAKDKTRNTLSALMRANGK